MTHPLNDVCKSLVATWVLPDSLQERGNILCACILAKLPFEVSLQRSIVRGAMMRDDPARTSNSDECSCASCWIFG